MNILAIDTSTPICLVALAKNNEFFESAIHQSNQSQIILSEIDSLLTQANLKLNQLDAIAFGCGPGSFTGVRIAASVVQALSFALNISVIKLSSLQILAQSAYAQLGWTDVLTAIDARMNEVYSGYYRLNDEGIMSLHGPERVISPQLLSCPDTRWQGVGNAWSVYEQTMPARDVENCAPDVLLNAQALMCLARASFEKKEFVSINEVLPTYLRDKVAQTEAERKGK